MFIAVCEWALTQKFLLTATLMFLISRQVHDRITIEMSEIWAEDRQQHHCIVTSD